MGRIKASNTHSQHCVQVKLELGHKATIRAKPTSEGFTHDWTVFVRGPEGSNIQHFVEKVVFLLHESFPKPKRVVKEPPYQVSESGYAGFVLPIEIYFKNKEEPKKVCFDYDLFLHIEGPPVNHIRCEKLTFQNPTEDFRRKLLKSGGVGVVGSEGGTVLGQQQQPSEPFTDIFGTPLTKAKSSPEPTRKHKSSSKEISKSSVSSSSHQKPQPPPPPEPFVALFGTPIKTNKASPDSCKLKDASKTVGGKSSKSVSSSSSCLAPVSSKESKTSIGKDAETKTVSKIKESKSSSAKEKEFKSVTKIGNKDSKAVIKEKENKLVTKISKAPVKKLPISPAPPPPSSNSNDSESLISKENKLAMKRPISPLSPKSEKPSEPKKRKRNSSSSESLAKPKEKHHIEKRPKKPKEIDKKEKETSERKDKHKTSSDKPRKLKKSDFELPEPRSYPDDEIKTIKKSSSHSDISQTKDYHSSASRDSHIEKSHSSNDCHPSPISSPDASPSSSISFSSLQTGRKHGPLTALMAELDDQDDDDELVSPLSSDPPSPPQFSMREDPPPPPPPPPPVVPKCSQPLVKPEKPEKPKHISRKSKKSSRMASESRINEARAETEISKSSAFTQEELEELVSMQHQIMTTGNDDLLQRIVDLIEESGLYTVTNNTFDFDLCTLDKETVRKIQGCIGTTLKKIECY